GAGINAAFYFVAPFTRDLHIARAAPFFAAYASTTIALRVFGRRLPDRMGAHPIAVPSFGVFALGLATLCLLPRRGVLVAAGMACGAGHGSLFPVLNGLAVTRTPPRFHGTVVSLYTAALDGGAVLGTPLCGAIAHTAGYRAMFAVMAAASRASDEWAYRQAKSIKLHLQELAPGGPADIERQRADIAASEERARAAEHERDEANRAATERFEQHHRFAVGTSLLQISIVLETIAAVLDRR